MTKTLLAAQEMVEEVLGEHAEKEGLEKKINEIWGLMTGKEPIDF